MIDRRTVLANDRVVHQALADRFPDLTPVPSRHFSVSVPVADILRQTGGARDRQLRHGDLFEVIEQRDGYAFGLGPEAFPYAGWVAETALRPWAEPEGEPYLVCARQTHAYSEPSFKSPERMALPHLAQVLVTAEEGRFARTDAGWVPLQHLSQSPEVDPVAVAEMYVGVPYLWGGNSIWGLDCSGLVQAGLLACGTPCLGDSDQQEARLGRTLAPGSTLQRGDLLFWKGHVAWVADAETLLHANVHHMAVAYEPITDAIARIDAQGDGPVTRMARL